MSVKSTITLRTRLLLTEGGKILLLKQTKPQGGNFTLIGGKVESAEFARQAIIREAKEEAGIVIKEKDLKLVHVLHRLEQDKQRIVLFFSAKNWQGTAKSKEPHKFKRVEWHPLSKLPNNLTISVRTVLDAYKQGQNYSEIIR